MCLQSYVRILNRSKSQIIANDALSLSLPPLFSFLSFISSSLLCRKHKLCHSSHPFFLISKCGQLYDSLPFTPPLSSLTRSLLSIVTSYSSFIFTTFFFHLYPQLCSNTDLIIALSFALSLKFLQYYIPLHFVYKILNAPN